MPRGVRRAGLAAFLLVVTLIAPAGAQVPVERQDGSEPADPASAKRTVDQERSRLVRRYDETLALEAERTAAYEQSVEAAGALAAEVTRLERVLAGVAVQLERAEERYRSTVAAQGRLATRLGAAQEELARRLSELRLSAVVAYVEASELGSLRGLNKAFDDQEGAIAVFYAGYVGDLSDARVAAVEAQQRRIEQLAEDAERMRVDAEVARADVDARRADAQRLRDEGQLARQRADAETVRQAQLVAEVMAQRQQYEQEMQALADESARLGELLRRQAAAAASRQDPAPGGSSGPQSGPRSTAPPAGGGGSGSRTGGGNGGAGVGSGGGGRSTAPPAPAPTNPAPAPTNPAPPTTNNAGSGSPPKIAVSLSYPLPGWPVVSKYGWRVHPILGTRKLHEGIDIWANAGTGIAAAAGGSVVWVGPRNGYGNAVVIDHGSGVGTLYAHLSGFNVGNGQRVSRGATIGFVGQTGLAAGPHLHFEVRVNGRTYDPLAYVRPG